MKKIIRLTESDLARIVKRVLMEQPIPTPNDIPQIPGLNPKLVECLMDAGLQISVENGEQLKICEKAITNPMYGLACVTAITKIASDSDVTIDVITKAQACIMPQPPIK